MNSGFIYSLFLHGLVVLFLWVDLPSFWKKEPIIYQTPIIVDLADVKIGEITNLPTLIEKKETKKQAGGSNAKEAKPAPPKPKPAPPKPRKIEKADDVDKSGFELEEANISVEKAKKKEEKKKEEKKVKKQQNKEENKDKRTTQADIKSKPKAPVIDNSLKSLLASVGELKKDIEKRDASQDTIGKGIGEGKIGEEGIGDVATKGIKGGIGGSYFRELSISEKDAIAGRLRDCWNLDAGARGIEDMVVELRTYLNIDGTVKKVEIIDKSRYRKDSFYRSVAESAVRAVHICAPYKSLADRHKDKYEIWNTLFLRFNPLDGGVF